MTHTLTMFVVALLVAATAESLRAQDPGAPPDTAAATADTSDSLEAIEARLMGEFGAPDSAAPAARATSASTLNPDLSLIADFLLDLSPDEPTLEEAERFQLREVEIGIQGAVDPYFRYDAFLGIHGDAIEVEEAYATTLALPASLQARLGRFLLPFGKVNRTHRAELPMFDLPLAHREFFGEEGLSSTGLWGSWIGAPLGFFQELAAVAAEGVEAHAHGDEEHAEDEEEESGQEAGRRRDLLRDLGDRLWLAHLKSSFDLSPASNLELGLSWATAIVEEEEARARANLYGLDATWRWKPPRLGTYRSAILQAEALWRAEPGPGETKAGAFAFAQWQLARRWFVGARADWVEPPEEPGSVKGGQLLVRWFPTEFSQLRLAYERQDPEFGEALDRLVFQTTFALGPHRPHAY